MARSRFSTNDPESAAQVVDVRVRSRGGSNGSRSRDGGNGNSETTARHLIWLSATHIFLALVAVIMVAAWIERKRGGFTWMNLENVAASFNYHPLFMVIAFMLLSGIADILYRMCRTHNKLTVKLAHGIIQLAAFCFIVSALCAVFWYHDQMGVPHMQSAHSWIGLIIVILVSCQWLVGFCGLLWPGFRPPLRASYVVTHKFTGRCIFLLSLGNILIGINKVGGGTTIMNVTALVVILYALNGAYILAKDKYARGCGENGDEQGVTVYERSTAIHNAGVDEEIEEKKYINISPAVGGQYSSLGEDPGVREAMSVGRDTFNRFHDRLEKKKGLDLTGEFVVAPTTTITD